MMGVGCHRDGGIFISDRSFIKKTNLNRQFLFRSSDIGVRILEIKISLDKFFSF